MSMPTGNIYVSLCAVYNLIVCVHIIILYTVYVHNLMLLPYHCQSVVNMNSTSLSLHLPNPSVHSIFGTNSVPRCQAPNRPIMGACQYVGSQFDVPRHPQDSGEFSRTSVQRTSSENEVIAKLFRRLWESHQCHPPLVAEGGNMSPGLTS